MRITKLDLEINDIEWFALDIRGRLLRFTSGVHGNVPEFVCKSKEILDKIQAYFWELPKITDANILVGQEFGKDLLDECREMSERGLYCFDAYNGHKHMSSYTKLSAPQEPLTIRDLHHSIQRFLENNIINIEVDRINETVIKNAY